MMFPKLDKDGKVGEIEVRRAEPFYRAVKNPKWFPLSDRITESEPILFDDYLLEDLDYRLAGTHKISRLRIYVRVDLFPSLSGKERSNAILKAVAKCGPWLWTYATREDRTPSWERKAHETRP